MTCGYLVIASNNDPVPLGASASFPGA